jgi:hypothetical protein
MITLRKLGRAVDGVRHQKRPPYPPEQERLLNAEN